MTVRTGRIRRKWRARERAFGAAIQLPSPDLVEVVGAAGYDYAWLDAEHGCFSLSDLRNLIRAADAVGIDSIVRVPNHDPSYIQRVLDLGAAGIMAPHVRSVDETKALVAAARYSPGGIRGACPFIRSVNHVSLDWKADYTAADEDVIVLGLIEDVEGMENVEAIAAVPGLDGLVYGPFDLGMALGYHGDVSQPELRAQHDRVVAACRAASIDYVTAGVDWEFGAYPDTGSRLVTVVSDRGTVYAAFNSALVNVKALADNPAPSYSI
ncbi:HpcH/HpaI aldolase/citrate lyase family protein [Nocardia tengchongensis]|uniref:HpcH/HpaI aldolase family protein n=1 Tax=Nocardia tengchongensis TaxID=2055889 RepID=UPI0036841CE1